MADFRFRIVEFKIRKKCPSVQIGISEPIDYQSFVKSIF
jgi:hypothetical protein